MQLRAQIRRTVIFVFVFLVVLLSVAVIFQILLTNFTENESKLTLVDHSRALWIGNMGVVTLVTLLLAIVGSALAIGSISTQLTTLGLSLESKISEFMNRITPLVHAASQLKIKST